MESTRFGCLFTLTVGTYFSAVAINSQLRHVTGSCVLLVHHTGRDGKEERGSTALAGAADTKLKLKENGKALVVLCEKQKTAPEMENVQLHIKTSAESVVLVSWPNETEINQKQLQGLKLVSLKPLTHRQWREAFMDAGLGASTLGHWLKLYKEKGLVEVDSSIRSPLYILTEKGAKLVSVSWVSCRSQPESDTARIEVSPVLCPYRAET